MPWPATDKLFPDMPPTLEESMSRLHMIFAMPLFIAVVANAAPTAPAPPPTLAEVQQLYNDAKYTDVIKTVVKITTAKAWQENRPDAYELFCAERGGAPGG